MMSLNWKMPQCSQMLMLGSQMLMLALLVLANGCTDDRNATTPGTLYHCSTDGDCLSGWTCQCGYCQQPGAQQYVCGIGADADAGSGDVGVGDSGTSDSASGDLENSDSVDSGSSDTTEDVKVSDSFVVGQPTGNCNNVVTSDMTPAGCNLNTWNKCPSNQGCYYAPAGEQKYCQAHDNTTENSACDPCKLSQCGLSADQKPLICDFVDKKCYRTCDWTTTPNPCPQGQQCFKLTDGAGKIFPENAGICAPCEKGPNQCPP